jgi:hypothetical protein
MLGKIKATMTTKTEDQLNQLLSAKPEDEVVETYKFICRSEDRIRNAHRKRRLGSLIRQKDPFAYADMECHFIKYGRLP